MNLTDFLACPEKFSVAVLGFGRSGRAAADFLLSRGVSPMVYSESEIEEKDVAAYKARGVRFFSGAFPAAFAEDVLVRSPVIRPDIPAIQKSVARGALLTAESELAAALLPCPLVAVTGSDGKTTTANLIAALLQAAGIRTWLGGNNGTPLLGKIAEMSPSDLAVMELSSFQLMTWQTSPLVAVLTNIVPNHLDWHTDMAEYVGAKCRLLRAGTHAVLNAENACTRELARTRGGGKVTLFSPDPEAALSGFDFVTVRDGKILCHDQNGTLYFDCLGDFRLCGRHNLENLLAALAATKEYITPDAAKAAVAAFRGVAHRLQYVNTVAGVHYYNSSIDTSPTRTAAALSAIGTRPVVIAGGRGKGVSLAPLADTLAKNAKAVFLYGEAAAEIEAALASRIVAHRYTRFAEAFRAAADFAVAGDTVLLSPGCTAFGEFRDFEERGAVFCEMVAALAAERIKKSFGTEGENHGTL